MANEVRPSKVLCISDRCGICTFKALDGEQVAIVNIRDGTTLTTYDYKREVIRQDRRNGFKYHFLGCLFWYQRAARSVVLCHTDCLARERSTSSAGRFWATMYAYDPPPAEVKRHERWLLAQFALSLRSISEQGPVPLPLEICEMIAQHCCPVTALRRNAADAGRALWEKYGSDDQVRSTHTFDIATKAWARYVEFEGVQYIGCITNRPEDTPDQQAPLASELTLLYTPLPDDAVDTLYIVEDHLGVRNIIFTSSLTNSEIHHNYDGASVHWRRLKIIPGTRFRCNTDNTKLRSLDLVFPQAPESVGLPSVSDSEDAFDRPPRPNQKLRAHNTFEWDDHPFRMTSFVCNDPRTAGYSVFCFRQPWAILPHMPPRGERDLEVYAAQERRKSGGAVWLYASRNPDEVITEIWVRVQDGGYEARRSVAIVTATYTWFDTTSMRYYLRTNQDRTLVMGPYPHKGHHVYTLVYRGGSDPSRIYVDTGDRGLRRFLFESPLPAEPNSTNSSSAVPNDDAQKPKGLPSPKSPCPIPIYVDEARAPFIFYSSADMYGVAKVTLCRPEQGTISGMVLRYHDGRQETLGQVRPDRLASSGRRYE
ncbi:hypothetical protein B0J18DRAFT_458210 [Chaetomium sp. MPI-SDFR-AT-0129]|nr:hypothetical protein B0J18DRAFT_458210 [Chaetomium sp. MPI-SDFR-AT-0129]